MRTALDVIQKALQLYKAQDFDCPYCAIADAQTAFLYDSWPITREELYQQDAPLNAAREALKPFNAEIAACPSPVSRARSLEMLRHAADTLRLEQE